MSQETMPDQVAIISGSISNNELVEITQIKLQELNIKFRSQILSAHRDLVKLQKYVEQCDKDGIKIYIAIAGMAAALPGVVASLTDKPVIGVPAGDSLMGLDSLLSIVQMPKGVPVATVSIGRAGAENAAFLASRILNVS